MTRFLPPKSLLLAAFAFLSVAYPLAAQAQQPSPQLPGLPCTALGLSTMADDQQNIVACLKDGSGNLVWKAMNSGGSNEINSGGLFIGEADHCLLPNSTGKCGCPSGFNPTCMEFKAFYPPEFQICSCS